MTMSYHTIQYNSIELGIIESEPNKKSRPAVDSIRKRRTNKWRVAY